MRNRFIAIKLIVSAGVFFAIGSWFNIHQLMASLHKANSFFLLTATIINGWGIREFAMIYLWKLFGVAESEAFLISLYVGIVAILSSLPGLWFWLKKNHERRIDIVHATHSADPLTGEL